jgi:TolA-binding protein
LIIVVVAIVVVLALTVGRAQAQRRRHDQADGIREESAARARDIDRREAEVDEMEAAAQRARAEADQRVAQAQQMQSEVEETRASLEQERTAVDERLQHADRIDPMVDDAPTTPTSRPSPARAAAVEGGSAREDLDENAEYRDEETDEDAGATTPAEPASTRRSERG